MTELAIEVHGVDKAYRFFQLSGLSLALEPGQILGFVGPNGAGKSTTIRILMALVHQDCGEVRVLGHSMPRELTGVMSDERRSILFSSQNTQDVEQISDQITFLDRGRIIESSDKETFVERWRGLRLDVPPGVELPALPEVTELATSGRLATATVSAYTDDVAAAFTRAGAVVHEVQRMTLEEIFVANVMSSRKEAAA
jgi:ABC-2 type transport system ATP-binding protein